MSTRTLLDETLTTFAKGLGLEGLPLNNRGVVCLEFERSGRFFIEDRGDRVLVYLSRMLPRVDPDTLRKALEMCHFSAGHEYPVQAGLSGDGSLVFAVCLGVNEFTPHLLDRCLILLDGLHQAIE